MAPRSGSAEDTERCAAALRALREYVLFARRTASSLYDARSIQRTAQALLQAPEQHVHKRAVDTAFVAKLGKARDFTSVDVATGARSVLTELVATTPDSAAGEEVRLVYAHTSPLCLRRSSTRRHRDVACRPWRPRCGT